MVFSIKGQDASQLVPNEDTSAKPSKCLKPAVSSDESTLSKPNDVEFPGFILNMQPKSSPASEHFPGHYVIISGSREHFALIPHILPVATCLH
jgi:hypothetical protein